MLQLLLIPGRKMQPWFCVTDILHKFSESSYFSFMKKWIFNNRLYFAGAITGGIAGFLYWKFVGCINGTCVITSNPLRSTIYFAVMGALIFGIFKKEKKKLNDISEQR